jgi:hypothetical protein
MYDKINITIKYPTGDLTSFCIDKCNTDKLMSNIKLYEKNFDFISNYIKHYSTDNCNEYFPADGGIIFIDMQHNIILDHQQFTSTNKISPNEIRISKNGKIPNEDESTSVVTRFTQLVNDGRLIGLELWTNSGVHLNTDVCVMTVDELFVEIMDRHYYGQFVFNTAPFRVELFEKMYIDKFRLFKKTKEFGLIPAGKDELWQNYLKGE